MGFKNQLVKVFFFLALQTPLHAEKSTLTITLINHSSFKFVFDRVALEFANTTLDIDKKILLPGENASIVGTATPRSDLSGIVYFNGDAKFVIVDQRQFHIGQPLFSMLANYTSSRVLSRTRNPIVGPKLLHYTAATVELKDKL